MVVSAEPLGIRLDKFIDYYDENLNFFLNICKKIRIFFEQDFR